MLRSLVGSEMCIRDRGIIGELKDELSEIEFLDYLKTHMDLSNIRHSNFTGKKLKKICVLGGSGSFAIEEALINEIVDEAANILSSEDPVESKIIKLNAIAEKSVDINGIGMYTLGKYRKIINEDQKSKYQKLFRSYFLKSFSISIFSDFSYRQTRIQNTNQDVLCYVLYEIHHLL